MFIIAVPLVGSGYWDKSYWIWSKTSSFQFHSPQSSYDFFFFAVHMITLVLYSIWPWQLVVLLIFESVTYFDVYFFTLNTIQISEDFFFFPAWKKGCVIKHLVFPCFENCADTTSDAIGSTHVLTWIRKQLCSKCCVLV